MGDIQTVTSDGYDIQGPGAALDAVTEALKPETAAPAETPAVTEEKETAQETPKEGRARREDGTFAPKGAGKAETASEAKAEAEGSEPATDTEKPKKQGNPRHDPRARVEQATAMEAEWRRRAEEADNRLNTILQAIEAERQVTRPAPGRPEIDPNAPTRDQYETDQDFYRAEARYEAKKEAVEQFRSLREQEARAQYEAQMERARSQAFSGFKERIDKAGGQEFLDNLSEEVLNLRPLSALAPGERPSPMNAIAEQIVRSEFSTGLMQYFTENPTELQRLPTLHPQDAMRAIGRIEARFEAAAQTVPAPRVEISKASPPVKTVTGVTQTSPPLPDETADYDTWRKAELARRKR